MRKNLIVIGSLVLANYAVIAAQSIVGSWGCDMSGLPESRYWIQSLILLVPLVPLFALRFKLGSCVLGVGVVLLVATALIYTFKAVIPGTRRHHQLAACEWAADFIRKDYRGPAKDAETAFAIDEYSRPDRPVVDAMSARVGLMLGGRNGTVVCGYYDVPDYIVDEPHRINRLWYVAADYDAVAERKFGKRTFVMYRKTRDKERPNR